MPIVKDIYDNFIKEYGKVEGKKRYFRWENSRPKQYRESLKTARSRGDKLYMHAPKKRKNKRKKEVKRHGKK